MTMPYEYEGVELVPWTSSYKAPPKPPREPQKRGRKTNAEKGIAPPVKLSPDAAKAKTREECRTLWPAALKQWIEHDNSPLQDLQEVGEAAYLATFKRGKKSLNNAEWSRLAALVPGRLNPMPDNKGVTWQRGGGGTRGWLLTSPGQLAAVEAAHQTMLSTIPASDRPNLLLPFTIGGVSRYMVAWTGIRQHCFKFEEKLLAHPEGYAYRRAIPGVYPANYVYWDVSAYYYSLISKLPCPLLMVMPNRILFETLAGTERGERWSTVIDSIGHDKGLRNALLGVMQGSYEPRISFSKAHPEGFVARGQGGPLRAAALLIVRAGHELTQLENIGGESIWGHTDCAVLPEGVEPNVWRSKGLSVASKALGDAHIIDSKTYRVGARKTMDYDLRTMGARLSATYEEDGEEVGEKREGIIIPEVQYHRSFL